MKQSYTDYLNDLSGNRMDILEELITTKYKKFRKFYKTVSNYSSDIAHVSYRFSDSESLNIDITVNPDIDAEEFILRINSDADEKYIITAAVITKVICMTISRR